MTLIKERAVEIFLLFLEVFTNCPELEVPGVPVIMNPVPRSR